MGACTARAKDFDDQSSYENSSSQSIEIPYVHSNRKIQKRPSHSLRRVHFAENDKGEILEQIHFITPRKSVSYNKLAKIWKVLDKDKDGILNLKELCYFTSTVFLDVLESDVRDMLKKGDSDEMAEGVTYREWLRILKNTDAEIKVLVDDLYRVFCLGVEITDPNDSERRGRKGR